MRLHGCLAIASAVFALVAACASPPIAATPIPTSTPAALVTPAASTKPTVSPTPRTAIPAATPGATAAASVGANTFVSERYPYALTYPPGTMQLGWHKAERTWDGQALWEMGGPYPDVNLIAEGGLYIFGSPTAGLDEFLKAIEANGERHRCTQPENRREATINGAAAIGFTQVCDLGTAFARVILVKDGYGIAMFVNTRAGAEIAGRDKALELLQGLEWRTG